MANKEQISALMDGDLSEIKVLNELGTDPAMQDTWSRYHLIGDAMRGDLPVNLQLDLSDSIMLALEDEPTILAPAPAPSTAPGVKTGAKVIPLLRRFGQQVGQYAIAASVAAAVIFGVQQYQGQDGVPNNPVLNTIPVGGSATPVSVHYPQEGNRATTRQQGLNEQQMQEQRERVNAFLRDHQLQQRLLQDKQIQE
ncbi:sigma-E factor negative regulatory protein [Aeromonas sp. AE23HZ002T15]